jgi:hypothetical protein
MGIVGDFFSFVGSMLLGKKTSSNEFLEALTMAERYMRWGSERGDLRDFQSAFDHLEFCDDNGAPRPDLVLRKYGCLSEVAIGAVDLLIKKYHKDKDGVGKSKDKMLSEKKSLEVDIQTAKKRAEKLRAEGSVIKAKEEEKHVEEYEAKLAHYDRVLESDETLSATMTAYENMALQAERYLGRLEQSLVALEMISSLPQDAAAALRQQISLRLETARRQIQEQAPNVPES